MLLSIPKSSHPARPAADSITLEGYQKQVKRIIHASWQKECQRHRDFIIPGTVAFRFSVGPDGNVTGIQILRASNNTGAVQIAFTRNAIRNAKLPRMPEEFASDYISSPLQFDINFHF